MHGNKISDIYTNASVHRIKIGLKPLNASMHLYFLPTKTIKCIDAFVVFTYIYHLMHRCNEVFFHKYHLMH